MVSAGVQEEVSASSFNVSALQMKKRELFKESNIGSFDSSYIVEVVSSVSCQI